ncbi:MAG: hypothetical protein HOO89_10335 [Ferruginibacter sp.]|nr:hypothetical protein [Ferruginibacter sp.]
MTKKIKSLILSFCCIISLNSFAQKIKITEGNLDILKSETTINVEFTYDNMAVGKFDKESEYIDKKKGEYNAKEAGRGDRWEKSWVSDRKRNFEPKFIDLFEKTSGMTIKADSKYTLIFHTTTTEPGYNIYVTKKNAEIDATVTIVETANRTKVLAVIDVRNAPGRTFSGDDYASGDRITECYAVAGKKLGKFIK